MRSTARAMANNVSKAGTAAMFRMRSRVSRLLDIAAQFQLHVAKLAARGGDLGAGAVDLGALLRA
jgi:hypothetical protein